MKTKIYYSKAQPSLTSAEAIANEICIRDMEEYLHEQAAAKLFIKDLREKRSLESLT